MLGWEFPPFFAGGVGVVCFELTRCLSELEGVEIEYVMAYGPQRKDFSESFFLSSVNYEKVCSRGVRVSKVSSMIYSYDSPTSYLERFSRFVFLDYVLKGDGMKSIKEIYGPNLIAEVFLYAERVLAHHEKSEFDVIHAHDWTTIPAALALKDVTGKPVVFHVHITELDKTGGMGGHPDVFRIERDGFLNCDRLVCVSNFVRNRLINDYGIDSSKIEVIHNGGVSDLNRSLECDLSFFPDGKVVLFAGRMTLQKGPEYFLKAARKVLEFEPDVKFVMVGSGDMMAQMVELAIELGIYGSVYFHGKYSREEADRFFARADVFVMPSVSEPFGIVPLEAVVKGTPTIVSKQSGISEVLENCFKVDFWDVDEMAHKILALVKYGSLAKHMGELAFYESERFTWKKPAEKFYDLYNRLS